MGRFDEYSRQMFRRRIQNKAQAVKDSPPPEATTPPIVAIRIAHPNDAPSLTIIDARAIGTEAFARERKSPSALGRPAPTLRAGPRPSLMPVWTPLRSESQCPIWTVLFFLGSVFVWLDFYFTIFI